jgi:hypothetical protein
MIKSSFGFLNFFFWYYKNLIFNKFKCWILYWVKNVPSPQILPGTLECGLYRHTQIKVKLNWGGSSLSHWCLSKKAGGDLGTEIDKDTGRKTMWYRGRDWSGAAASQECLGSQGALAG